MRVAQLASWQSVATEGGEGVSRFDGRIDGNVCDSAFARSV